MLSRLDRVRRTQPDSGITLIELLVGMTLMAVVGAIGATLTVNTFQNVNQTTVSSQTDDGARIGVNQIAAEIRLADSPSLTKPWDGRFVTFDPTTTTFYSNRDATSRVGSQTRTLPSRVTIGVDTDADDSTQKNVVMRVWGPGVSSTATPTQQMTLIRNLQNRSVEPLFTYCLATPDPAQPTAAPAADATPAPQCNGVDYSSATSTSAITLRAAKISSVIVSARVVGGEVQATGGRRLPTTWLTTRVAVTGSVVSADAVSLP